MAFCSSARLRRVSVTTVRALTVNCSRTDDSHEDSRDADSQDKNSRNEDSSGKDKPDEDLRDKDSQDEDSRDEDSQDEDLRDKDSHDEDSRVENSRDEVSRVCTFQQQSDPVRAVVLGEVLRWKNRVPQLIQFPLVHR